MACGCGCGECDDTHDSERATVEFAYLAGATSNGGSAFWGRVGRDHVLGEAISERDHRYQRAAVSYLLATEQDNGV